MGRSASRAVRSLAGLLPALAIVLAAIAPAALAASDGDLDRTFGDGGRVTVDVFGGVDDLANAVAIQPDGKVVVAGSYAGFGSDGSTRTFALARFHPDGTPDPSFGTNGRVLTAFANGAAGANGVAIQPDGRIVAAGWWDDDDGVANADLALARYNPDGSLDPSFSGDGKLTSDAGGQDVANAVAIAPNGTIITAGGVKAGTHGDFLLARVDATGNVVLGSRIDFGAGARANAVTIQPDGKIVAAGFVVTNAGSDDVDFALARLSPSGQPDATFSADGTVTTPITTADDRATAVAIQSDGRIVAAGKTDGGDFALARYNPDGSLDPTFSGDGKQTSSFGAIGTFTAIGANAVAIQPDGKIVAAGSTIGDYRVGDDFALARYNPDGSLDPTFSGDGKQTTNFAGADHANAVALQPDGRIVAVGSTDAGPGGDYDFALARYLGDTIPPETLIDSGPSTITTDPTPTLEFRSTEPGSTFECALDHAAFTPCTSPHTTATLADGAHTFQVRATDPAGNTDPSPATRSFAVDTTPLATTSSAAGTPPTTIPAARGGPPVISRASLTHPRFRVGRTPTATTAAKRRRIPAGTRIRFVISEPANVTIRIERRLPGRRARRHDKPTCVHPTRDLRHHPRCARYRHAGTLIRTRPTGRTSIAFSGRIGHRKLPPGHYRLRITALDDAGNRSKTKTLPFTIIDADQNRRVR